jgi:hypothetical protein
LPAAGGRLEGVPRVDLEVAERFVRPDLDAALALGRLEPGARSAVGRASETRETGVDSRGPHRTSDGEVELGPGDVLLADRKGPLVRDQPARGRGHEAHVVDRDPHRQVGVEPDPERCRPGGGVRRTRDDRESVCYKPKLEAQLEPPRVRGLLVQYALQRDRVLGLGSEQPGEPTHEAVDRVPELGLVDRGRPRAAFELVSPAVETVRPRCQHLPAASR